MRMRRKVLPGVCVLALVLSGCGGAGSSAGSSGPSTPGPTGAPVPPPAGCESSSQQALVAAGLKFDRSCMTVPAHKATTLVLTNNDPGQSHDVAIYRWDSCFAQAARSGSGTPCADPTEGLRYKGNVIAQGQATYHILGFRPGRYAFICVVHPSMHGVFNVG